MSNGDCRIYQDIITPKLYGYDLSSKIACCDNQTVFCNDINNQTRITKIFLPNYQLKGWVPSELQDLNQLVQLSLQNNSLRGNLPLELANLNRLEYLELQFNQIQGPIPEEYGKLTALRDFFINDNELTGSVPISLQGLKNLTQFVLFNNFLQGTLFSSTVPNSRYVFLPQKELPKPFISPLLIPAIVSSVVVLGLICASLYLFYRRRNTPRKEEDEMEMEVVNDVATDYSSDSENVFISDVQGETEAHAVIARVDSLEPIHGDSANREQTKSTIASFKSSPPQPKPAIGEIVQNEHVPQSVKPDLGFVFVV